MSDVQVFNGTTRRWLGGEPLPEVAALVLNTFWETKTLNDVEYYQTFEGNIYRREPPACFYCTTEPSSTTFAPYCSAVCAGHARKSNG